MTYVIIGSCLIILNLTSIDITSNSIYNIVNIHINYVIIL